MLQRGSVVLHSVCAVLYSVSALYHVRRGESRPALLAFFSLLVSAVIPLALTVKQTRGYGEHWWRETSPSDLPRAPLGWFLSTMLCTVLQWLQIGMLR